MGQAATGCRHRRGDPKTQRRSDWRRLSAGAGTKGPRLHDWCYLELADLEGEESNHHSQVLWTRGLLIFAENDISFAVLPHLTEQDLKDLGITSVGHRRQLLLAMAELKDVQKGAAQAPSAVAEPP